MCSGDTGGGSHVCVLHNRLNPVVLSQDASEHARPVDPKRLVLAADGPHLNVVVCLLDKSQQYDGVDVGQEAHRPARRVLLHRVRLQRVVHVRDSHPVRRQPEQTSVPPRTRQHHRLRRHGLLLSRLPAHLPQEGLYDIRVLYLV